MKLLHKIASIFKKDDLLENHPHDIPLEQKMHENALAEIELLDK